MVYFQMTVVIWHLLMYSLCDLSWHTSPAHKGQCDGVTINFPAVVFSWRRRRLTGFTPESNNREKNWKTQFLRTLPLQNRCEHCNRCYSGLEVCLWHSKSRLLMGCIIVSFVNHSDLVFSSTCTMGSQLSETPLRKRNCTFAAFHLLVFAGSDNYSL